MNVQGSSDGETLGNILGTDGFAFLEFAAPDPAPLAQLFQQLGFERSGELRSGVDVYRQGEINFVLNGASDGPAAAFAAEHGPSASAMGFHVRDSAQAIEHALANGAHACPADGPFGEAIPAIEGIGGSRIYFVDEKARPAFEAALGGGDGPRGAGLAIIDHLTHNVRKGRMDYFAQFYGSIFNFREIRYFDIKGEYTGLTSRALTGPCGKLRIPINESRGGDQLDQIEEFIQQYGGEGIQHIALATDDIVATYDRLRANGIRFMSPPPDTYYEMLAERLPDHGEPAEELRKRGILLDGSTDGRILLQIFTETAIGPIFFEIIQRKGDEGFGEGNFKALFESMERDQIRRGVLNVEQ